MTEHMVNYGKPLTEEQLKMLLELVKKYYEEGAEE